MTSGLSYQGRWKRAYTVVIASQNQGKEGKKGVQTLECRPTTTSRGKEGGLGLLPKKFRNARKVEAGLSRITV